MQSNRVIAKSDIRMESHTALGCFPHDTHIFITPKASAPLVISASTIDDGVAVLKSNPIELKDKFWRHNDRVSTLATDGEFLLSSSHDTTSILW
eukprot:CAMPEP_0117433658 /NCGR_PEP_ID=MMETSP0758-20121206/12982_1 /TAXON_ID=63605 /ORGANISM="Percolomonas cosmopolitus, Strain AE-1 (ATCC 50343)" /LENGTH=93 /DNA_ID=CAMNT_0005224467 /DNA_START=208 /DNA_END=486 /DNA_ORIENTATION=+